MLVTLLQPFIYKTAHTLNFLIGAKVLIAFDFSFFSRNKMQF